MDLLNKQNQLQQQATEILGILGLIELLEKNGKLNIVGSMKLGLMTWRDIDIEVIMKKLDI